MPAHYHPQHCNPLPPQAHPTPAKKKSKSLRSSIVSKIRAFFKPAQPKQPQKQRSPRISHPKAVQSSAPIRRGYTINLPRRPRITTVLVHKSSDESFACVDAARNNTNPNPCTPQRRQMIQQQQRPATVPVMRQRVPKPLGNFTMSSRQNQEAVVEMCKLCLRVPPRRKGRKYCQACKVQRKLDRQRGAGYNYAPPPLQMYGIREERSQPQTPTPKLAQAGRICYVCQTQPPQDDTTPLCALCSPTFDSKDEDETETEGGAVCKTGNRDSGFTLADYYYDRPGWKVQLEEQQAMMMDADPTWRTNNVTRELSQDYYNEISERERKSYYWGG